MNSPQQSMLKLARSGGWLAVFVLALISAASAQPKAGDVVYTTGFEGDSTKSWNGLQPDFSKFETGFEGTQSLAVNSPVGGGLNVKVTTPLPLDKIRGARLSINAKVKAEGVVKPPNAWNGIKVMLHYKAAQDERWVQQNDVSGTFDWKTIGFLAAVPKDVTEAELVLGIENTTGKAWFDDVNVSVLSTLRSAPARPPVGEKYRGHNLPLLRGVMIHPNIDEDGLQTLAKWKVNLIRWQLMWKGFPHGPADDGDLAAYDVWLESALKQIDDKLPLCEKLGIMVVVDLHTPPGGRDKQNNWPLFYDKKYQDKFLELWDRIAKRYVGKKIIWGFDILNEPRENRTVTPAGPGVLDWHSLATVTAKRIRAIDPDHAIIIPGEEGGDIRGLQFFEPIDVPGVVYTLHFYDPGQFTHQGIPGNYPPLGPEYPGMIGNTKWDKERLRKSMLSAIQWQRDYNAQIYIGEFSAIRWAKGADQWLKDSMELFEEYGWDYSYHAFREYSGWSVEHGEIQSDTSRATSPTARQQVLLSAFAKNQHPVQTAPAFRRWLVIGDSITAHGPKADLKWTGPTRGMAASKVEKDYVHQLQGLLQNLNPKNALDVKIFGRFAKLSDGTLESMNGALNEIKTFDADLVTVQLGENDDLDKIGREEFEKRYRTLINGLLSGPRRPRIVCTGVWSPGTPLDPTTLDSYASGNAARTKDEIIAAICREKGLTFVPVAPFASKPDNLGAGENPGVKWHPNDNGMRAYAEAIFAAL